MLYICMDFTALLYLRLCASKTTVHDGKHTLLYFFAHSIVIV